MAHGSDTPRYYNDPAELLAPLELYCLARKGRRDALKQGRARMDAVNGLNAWHVMIQLADSTPEDMAPLVKQGCDINFVGQGDYTPLSRLFRVQYDADYGHPRQPKLLEFMLESKAELIVRRLGKDPVNVLSRCSSCAIDILFDHHGAGWCTNRCDGFNPVYAFYHLLHRVHVIHRFWAECRTKILDSSVLLPPLCDIVVSYLLDTPDPMYTQPMPIISVDP